MTRPSTFNTSRPPITEREKELITKSDLRKRQAMEFSSAALLAALEREHPRILRNLRGE